MAATNILLLLMLIIRTIALFEGDDCVVIHSDQSLQAGKCTNLTKCNFARTLLQNRRIPQTCGFNRNTPLVCCPVILNQNIKSFKTKADEKCAKLYAIEAKTLIVAHGEPARAREFPHMAAIGYGNKYNTSWLCGGSLISERFILTAAHCAGSNSFGPAKWVKLGELDFESSTEDSSPEVIDISNIFVHQNYKPTSHYNDIALLKLARSVPFSDYVSPACLQTEKSLPTNKLVVVGWGSTEFLGNKSNRLMKAEVNVIDNNKCAKRYARVSRTKLENGIVDDLQICAGDELGKDTCPGDSGGPLHYLRYEISDALPHFVVVGVTSFGKACGLENSCGVYTRVSAYISWIESIVWPSLT